MRQGFRAAGSHVRPALTRGLCCASRPAALLFDPAVYQELRDSGFEANSTTYNALISAYGKLGQLDRVLEVYKDMVWRGLERRWVAAGVCRQAGQQAGRHTAGESCW